MKHREKRRISEYVRADLRELSAIPKGKEAVLNLLRNLITDRLSWNLEPKFHENKIKTASNIHVPLLTCIIHTRSYCMDKPAAPQRNARSSSWKVGFTTFCIVIAVLTLMHSNLALSLRNSMNNAG